MKLEQQIVALREKRGLTQRQLAKLLGTSQPYVAKLESGRVKNPGPSPVPGLRRAASRIEQVESRERIANGFGLCTLARDSTFRS